MPKRAEVASSHGSFAKVLTLEDRAPARTVSFQYEGIPPQLLPLARHSVYVCVCVCVPVTGPGEELQAGDSYKSQELDSPPYQLTNVLFAAGACRASAGRRFQIVQPLAFQGHRIFNSFQP